MGTISKHKKRLRLIGSSQLKYAATYVTITFVVLLFLNIYAPQTIRSIVFRAQQTAMEDKAQLMVSALSAYETMDAQTAGSVIQTASDLHMTRVIVTDPAGYALYDSMERDSALGKLTLLPEVVEALLGNDVFYITYHDGVLESQAAMPVNSYNQLTGAVYLMEYDTDQGMLIGALETNLLYISLMLEVIVILFSLVFSAAFNRRMRRILESVKLLRDGIYEARIKVRGHDEVEKIATAFNELADRLKQSEEVRKQFVSNASHELKTPLASIKLLTDSILQNRMDEAIIREFVTDIGSEADRLTRLSEKLLELTRLDSVPQEEQEACYVAQTVERVLRMLDPLAQAHGIRLAAESDPDCVILSIEDDLYQILFNLVDNAIKYNRENGSVSIAAYGEEQTVIIRVCDTGVGIPPEAREHIFERFYRADKARSRKAGGAGLGLSIVHDMVKRNDGTISVTSGDDGGSCFTVCFPRFTTQEVAE